MDIIFKGLIAAKGINEEAKLQVFKKLEASGLQPHQKPEVENMLLALLPIWLKGEIGEKSIHAVKNIFLAWGKSHFDVAHKVIEQYMRTSFDPESPPPSVHIPPFCEVLSEFYSSESGSSANRDSDLFDSVICHMTGTALTMHELSTITSLLAKETHLIPRDTACYTDMLIVKMASLTYEDKFATVKQYIKDTSIVSKLVRFLWQQHQSPKLTIMQSLRAVFDFISRDHESGVFLALSTIIQSVPEVVIEEVCEKLVNDSAVADGQLKNSLYRMLEWLSWPKHQTLHIWIVSIARNLAKSGKQIILFEVTNEHIRNAISKLKYQPIQPTVLYVINHLLLLHQHCAQTFLACVPDLIASFDFLVSDDLKLELSRTLQVLIYMHPGHPEVYNQVLAKLTDYPALTDKEIVAIADQYKSMSKPAGMLGNLKTVTHSRNGAAFVGLYNLGNTCYLNAVVQALFNLDLFREKLLSKDPVVSCNLKALQFLFAFLKLTERSFVKPEQFVKECLPPWFTLGHQQDSNEFLRLLLDGAYEQQKSSNAEDMTSPFTGQSSTVIKCHGCLTESKRCERFYDIPLHFTDKKSSLKSVELVDLFNQAINPEELRGDNQFYCEKCGSLQDATRSIEELCTPKYLVFTLCRFSYNVQRGQHTKLKTDVRYPHDIDVLDQKYRLNAVIVHSGSSLNSGHYYTYARSLTQPSQWYLFNDDRVTCCRGPPISPPTNNRLSLDTPYLIFYTKVTDADHQTVDAAHDVIVASKLRSAVTRDNLMAVREWTEQKERTRKMKKAACKPNAIWYCNQDDRDDDTQPPAPDRSIDLSGSRFIC